MAASADGPRAVIILLSFAHFSEKLRLPLANSAPFGGYDLINSAVTFDLRLWSLVPAPVPAEVMRQIFFISPIHVNWCPFPVNYFSVRSGYSVVRLGTFRQAFDLRKQGAASSRKAKQASRKNAGASLTGHAFTQQRQTSLTFSGPAPKYRTKTFYNEMANTLTDQERPETAVP